MSAFQAAPRAYRLWLPFFSLLLGGVTVNVAGKQPDILYFDIACIWIIYQVYWRGFVPSFSGWTLRIGVFCLFASLVSTLVNSSDINRGLVATKVLAVGLLVYSVARRAQLGLLLPTLFGACASIFLLQNYQSLRYGSYEGVAGMKDEIEIALGRSNYVASILILLIPLAVAGACIQKGQKRWLFIVCAMLIGAGLLATMSRGAMVALAGATLLSSPFLLKAGVRMKHSVIAIGLLVISVALVPVDLIETNLALFAYRIERPDFAREEIMRASWEIFLENPLAGVGPGQLGEAINHQMVVPPYRFRYYNAHNLVLDALAEMGLPGLALLAMVGTVMWKAWAAVAGHPTAFNVAVWIALLAALMHNMVEASFEGQQFQVVFWAVAAMAGAPCHATRGTPRLNGEA